MFCLNPDKIKDLERLGSFLSIKHGLSGEQPMDTLKAIESVLIDRKREAIGLLERAQKASNSASIRPEVSATIAKLALSDLALIDQLGHQFRSMLPEGSALGDRPDAWETIKPLDSLRANPTASSLFSIGVL